MHQHFKMKEQVNMPGPNQYENDKHNTISSTFYGKFLTRNSSYGPSDKKALTKNSRKFNGKMYYKELERGYSADISPGPAAYNNNVDRFKTLSHVKKSFGIAFSKVV